MIFFLFSCYGQVAGQPWCAEASNNIWQCFHVNNNRLPVRGTLSHRLFRPAPTQTASEGAKFLAPPLCTPQPDLATCSNASPNIIMAASKGENSKPGICKESERSK